MELLEKALGEPFDPKYFTDYLEEKFTKIYGLA
jgi:Zn-dependent M32 family carboxypeptidase